MSSAYHCFFFILFINIFCFFLNAYGFMNLRNDSGSCGNEVTWTYSDGKLTIKGTGDMENYNSVNASPWKNYSSSIHTVEIESGVTSIGNFAFQGNDLSTLIISNTVISIGHFAFKQCYNLMNLTLPDSVISLGNYSFAYCNKIKRIRISENVKEIGGSSFYNCHGLTSVVIPDGVESIGVNAFGACYGLKTVFYEGSTIFTSPIFQNSKLKAICVPPDYNYSSFGGKNVTSSNETCQEFRKLFNHCYKASYNGDEFVQELRNNVKEMEKLNNNCYKYECKNDTGIEEKIADQEVYERLKKQENECYKLKCGEQGWMIEMKRNGTEWENGNSYCYEYRCENSSGWFKHETDNATEWKKRSNECIEYVCEEANGLTWKSICHKNDNQICMNNECVLSSTNDKLWSIETEFEKEQKADEMNATAIMNNLNLICAFDPEEMKIGWEIDENDNVVRVIVYVNDKQTADSIAKALNGCV